MDKTTKAFPKMVRDFQAIVGIESKEQFLEILEKIYFKNM